jgi:hypothetical protein
VGAVVELVETGCRATPVVELVETGCLATPVVELVETGCLATPVVELVETGCRATPVVELVETGCRGRLSSAERAYRNLPAHLLSSTPSTATTSPRLFPNH